MANEILQKSRTRITAQSNGTALTATYDPNSGSYTGDTPVVIDNTYGAGENGSGADYLQLELNVTTGPTTAATAQIWFSGSEDGTNYTKWKYSHTIGESIIASTADRYDGGLFAMSYQYVKLAVVAISYGFTASLLATPKLPEVQ